MALLPYTLGDFVVSRLNRSDIQTKAYYLISYRAFSWSPTGKFSKLSPKFIWKLSVEKKFLWPSAWSAVLHKQKPLSVDHIKWQSHTKFLASQKYKKQKVHD